ncbi:MAG: hypothetical protein K6357_02940 [Elusimicrobiota bacterium]
MISLFLLLIFPLFSDSSFSDRNINFVLNKDKHGEYTSINYSFKFSSLKDLKYIYKIPANFYYDISNIELRDSFRVRYYGYNSYPFRYFIGKKKKIEFQKDSQNNEETSEEKKEKSKDIYRLSLSPFFEDIRENIDYYLFDFLMKNLTDEWSGLKKMEKKEFIKDITSIDTFGLVVLNYNKESK